MDECRALQARDTFDLCLTWFDRHREVVEAAQPQCGEASFYQRRRPADSELDPNRSLVAQFNMLRVVDNQRYPAFFYAHGRRYILNFQSD